MTSTTALSASPETACGGGDLYLYQNAGFGGDESILESAIGILINLSGFGFGDEVSSRINTFPCSSFAFKSENGTGSGLTMTAKDQNSYVGSFWNDAIDSAVIA
jgi:hypothetical protein